MIFTQPVPELPVRDVEAAQIWYRDKLGFKIEWLYPSGDIGAVSHGETAIFFRRSDAPIPPATLWVFAEDVDAAYADIQATGVDIVDPIANKPWGLRQFTFQDMMGNRFHVHHDLVQTRSSDGRSGTLAGAEPDPAGANLQVSRL
ncbi:MAG: VOC family protein [Pseudomonadota bacterium]